MVVVLVVMLLLVAMLLVAMLLVVILVVVILVVVVVVVVVVLVVVVVVVGTTLTSVPVAVIVAGVLFAVVLPVRALLTLQVTVRVVARRRGLHPDFHHHPRCRRRPLQRRAHRLDHRCSRPSVSDSQQGHDAWLVSCEKERALCL